MLCFSDFTDKNDMTLLKGIVKGLGLEQDMQQIALCWKHTSGRGRCDCLKGAVYTRNPSVAHI